MKAYILLFFKGAAMGAADVVPGVSGGTIAFITGIYGQLLNALSNIPAAAALFCRGRFNEAWTLAHANFLLVLLAGILTSILSLARLVSWLLAAHEIVVWSFFFGLVLVSCIYVGREIRRWNVVRIVLLLGGAALAWYITVAAPMNWNHDLVSIFFAGAIAICAMLLPGVSGSFLLVLMGLYGYILEALKNIDLPVIVVFSLGCLFGLLAFARILRAALARYSDAILALLTGIMLGSLNKIWPWKQTVTWFEAAEGVKKPALQENLLPWNFTAVTGHEAYTLAALGMTVLAVLIVVGIEQVAQRQQRT